MRPVYKCPKGYSETPGPGCQKLLEPRDRLRLSKLLTLVLRHSPEALGLQLTDDGWASIDVLAEAVRSRPGYSWVSKEHILALASTDPKGRFELGGDMIRARYGHSLRVKVDYPEYSGSGYLYHGTTRDAYEKIRAEGLVPGRRLWVHLSTSLEDAYWTARRHGSRVVVLRVDVECVRAHGVKLYSASPRVKLAKHVPPGCLSVIE